MTTLAWEGCLNVRDLGGLPTEDGSRTRAGSIIRSDNIRRLSEAGWRSLADHGVDRIVDLRFPEELADDPPCDVDLDVVHVSVLGPELDLDYIAELDAHLFAVDDVSDHYAWSYVDWLERFRERFGRALEAVAAADGPVVVHCVGGKDRTGLIAALLLRLAGVSRDTIGEDYALSAGNLEPNSKLWIEAADDEQEREKRRRLSGTPAAGMIRTIEEIERRYGDVASYLRAAGLSEAQIARLRERLVAS